MKSGVSAVFAGAPHIHGTDRHFDIGALARRFADGVVVEYRKARPEQ